jgi:uncharacterized protein
MPVQTTFPGVYVQEVPSGVRTIVGVSTSVTAFVGAARQGPVDTPVRVRSIAEYVRVFGPPLDAAHPMGHAVGHFFANGGSQALVVRVVGAAAEQAAVDLRNAATAPATVLRLRAIGEGTWANKVGGVGMEVAVDHAATSNPADLFTLTVRLRGCDPRTGASVVAAEETYQNLSMAPSHPRHADTMLAASALVSAVAPATPLATTDQATSLGVDLGAGNVTLPAGGTLRLAVDHGPPADLVIVPETTDQSLPKAQLRSRIDAGAAAAGLPVDTSSSSGNRIGLSTTGSGGLDRSVVVLPAAGPDVAQVLGLGLTWGGTEVSGAASVRPAATGATPLGFAGGVDADPTPDEVVPTGGVGGVFSLGVLDFPRFNLLCLPDVPASDPADPLTAGRSQALARAMAHCQQERAFLLVDTPLGWDIDPNPNVGGLAALGEHGAIYYPRLTIVEQGPGGLPLTSDLPTCGAVAGIMARTDAALGVWTAPAGLGAGVVGIAGLSEPTDDGLSGLLNPLGVNVLRAFPGAGTVLWGARTLKGADSQASEFKYIPVRRLTNFIASSLYLGTQFAVFAPNDVDLHAQLRLAVGTFMRGLFRAGAFQQSSSRSESDSYFVTCDETVNPQSEIDLGRVNVVVGFAPLKPAEFVILTITQISKLEA